MKRLMWKMRKLLFGLPKGWGTIKLNVTKNPDGSFNFSVRELSISQH